LFQGTRGDFSVVSIGSDIGQSPQLLRTVNMRTFLRLLPAYICRKMDTGRTERSTLLTRTRLSTGKAASVLIRSLLVSNLRSPVRAPYRYPMTEIIILRYKYSRVFATA
jgi:hypothetical protein